MGDINGGSKLLVSLALAAGLGSGSLSLVGSNDGYYGNDARRDLALRDERILYLSDRITALDAYAREIQKGIPDPGLVSSISTLNQELKEIRVFMARQSAMDEMERNER
tara:strand:- start:32571 stop:32897 length:327 start_codon:yes stop_codon:yes gene_type:complete